MSTPLPVVVLEMVMEALLLMIANAAIDAASFYILLKSGSTVNGYVLVFMQILCIFLFNVQHFLLFVLSNIMQIYFLMISFYYFMIYRNINTLSKCQVYIVDLSYDKCFFKKQKKRNGKHCVLLLLSSSSASSFEY